MENNQIKSIPALGKVKSFANEGWEIFKTCQTFSEKNKNIISKCCDWEENKQANKVLISANRSWKDVLGTYLDAVVALLVDNRDISPAHALDNLDHGLHLVVIRGNGA